MFEGYGTGAVLLMGGEGHRFGSEVPKQFHFLGGKRVYLHTLEAFLKGGLFDEIVLVCHPKWMEAVREEAAGLAQVVKGGATRQASSYAGLKGFTQKPEIVSIHDAVRPFISQEILLENLRAAIAFGAVDTCIPSTDTLVYSPRGKIIEQIPRRSDFLRGQTPQTFRYEWILKAHEWALQQGLAQSSDDCQLVLAMGREIRIVSGNEENLKITSETDLQIAEAFLERWATGKKS